MKFQYKLDGDGWAEGFIESNSQRCEFNPSYLTNALGDLLENLVSILNYEPNPKKSFLNTVSFIWDEEPSGIEWSLTRLKDEKVSLTIKRYDDIGTRDSEKFCVQINTICSLCELLTEVIREVELLLKNHEIIGYKDSWYSYEFPLSSYLKLKHFLRSKNQIEAEFIPNKDNEYGGHFKSDLNLELDYLKELVTN